MTDIEIIRDWISRERDCRMPCACYRNPQPRDCQSAAQELAAALARKPVGEFPQCKYCGAEDANCNEADETAPAGCPVAHRNDNITVIAGEK